MTIREEVLTVSVRFYALVKLEVELAQLYGIQYICFDIFPINLWKFNEAKSRTLSKCLFISII